MKKLIILILVILVNLSFADDYSNALKLYAKGYYTEAYDLFCKIDKSKIDNQIKLASLNYYKADCLLKMGIIDGATNEFERLVTYEPYSYYYTEALFALMNIYYDKKDFPKLYSSANKLFTYGRNYKYLGTAYYLVGQAYFQEKKYDNAIENFKMALDNYTTNKYIPNTYFALAYSHEMKNNYEEAVKNYELLLSNFSNSTLAPSATVRIGICYYKLKQFDNCIVELKDTIVTTLPKNNRIESNYVLANAYYQNGDFDNAIRTLDNTLKQFPSNYLAKEIRYTLAFAYFQKKDYNEAFKIFNLLSKYRDTISSYALFWSAECKRYENKYPEALQYYEEYLNVYPYGPQVNDVKLNMANILILRNDYNKALQILTDLLNKSGELFLPKVLISLGEVYLKQNKAGLALNYFNTAEIKSQQEDIQFRTKLARAIIAYQQNKFEEAKFYLNQIKNANIDKDLVTYYLAEVEAALKNYSQAIRLYDNVKKQDYEKLVLYGKAYAYFNAKDYETARFLFEDYTKKYSNEPNINDALTRLADCYYALRKYKEANNIYSELSKKAKSGSDDYASYQYAQSLYRLGNHQAALEELANFQKRFPKSKYLPEVIYLSGWINAQKEDYNNAIQQYKKVIKSYPETPLLPVVLLSTGDAYYNQENYDSSMAYYKRVLYAYNDTTYINSAVSGIIYIATNKNELGIAYNVLSEFVNATKEEAIKNLIKYKIVEMYYNAGEYSNVINVGKMYVDTTQTNNVYLPDLLLWIGNSYSKNKQYEDAKYYLLKLINDFKTNDLTIDAAISLGRIYALQKDYDSEIKIYEKVISYFPDDDKIPELHYRKGLACLQKGDISEAAGSFNDVIIYFDQSPFVPKAKYELAILELSKKNYQTSETLLKEISVMQNDDVGVKAQFNLGISQMEQKNYNDAISNFIRIINFYPDFPEWHIKAYFKIAECYEIMKDNENAKKIYQTIIQLNFNQEYTKEAQKKLKNLK